MPLKSGSTAVGGGGHGALVVIDEAAAANSASLRVLREMVAEMHREWIIGLPGAQLGVREHAGKAIAFVKTGPMGYSALSEEALEGVRRLITFAGKVLSRMDDMR